MTHKPTPPSAPDLNDLLADPLRGTLKDFPSRNELEDLLTRVCDAIGPDVSIGEIEFVCTFLLKQCFRTVADRTTTREELSRGATRIMLDVETICFRYLTDLLVDRP